MDTRMFSFLTESDYDFRKIGRDEANGLIVSTCYTSDEGYETAILDSIGAYPVERYTTKKSALSGHAAWVSKISEGLTHVKMLGWLDLVEDGEVIELKPRLMIAE